MTAVSLFAGIGGFDLALERAGHQVIWANEYDKYAADIYDKHFTGRVDRRDITTVPAGDIPDHDLLVGGFPCQSFSVAGHRRGFDDTRGTLFFDIARILESKRPAYCFLENVKGLLSHDGGRTFTIIIQTLDELGYDLQWQVCNSKDFGVPQNRERIFIVGHLRGTARPEVFPLTPTDRTHRQELTSTTIDANYWKGIDNHSARTAIVYGQPRYGDGDRSVEYKLSNEVPTIRATHYKNGDNQPKIIQKSQDWRENGSLREFSDYSPTIRSQMGDNHPMVAQRGVIKNRGQLVEQDQANCLDANYWKGFDNHGQRTGVSDGLRIRRLTPVECERLQGFPDGWTAEGLNGAISDTQRYKVCGNAVTVNVVQAIAEKLPI